MPLFATLINAMLEARGSRSRISEADARPHATAGGAAMVRALLGEECGEVDVELADFRGRYAALPTPPDSLYPGVRDTLARLGRAGVALAVWSNKVQPLCDKILVDLGLARDFAAIVGTSADVSLKPATTGLDRVLALAGSARGACCFIGDSDLDYEASRRAGVPFVMVTHGYGDYDRGFPGADVVPSFAGLSNIILRRLKIGEPV